MIILLLLSYAIFFTVFYTVYKSSVKDKAQRYSVDMIGQITKNIDSYFKGIESIALSLAYNPVIQKKAEFHENISLYEAEQQRANIENALQLFVYASQNIQIEILMEGQENTFYSMFTSINPSYNYKEDMWYKVASNTDSLKVIVLDNPQNYFMESDRKLVHTLVYKVKSMYTQDNLGYILMDINKDQFDQFFNNSYIDIQSTLMVYDTNNIIYQHPKAFNVENIRSSIPKDKAWGYFDIKIQKDDYMVVYGTSEYTDWKIINIIPYKILLKDLSTMKLLFVLISIAIFIFTALISFYFSSLITNPINKLMKGIEKLKKGQFNFSIPVMYEDEIGELVRNFNSMTQQIDFLIKRNETVELLRKETEFKALQQQINPHFLYNTLELVIGLACENKYKKIIEICKNLGSMFRYNLNDKKVVFIEDEVNQIKNYISILQERFEEKFTVNYEINSDVFSYKTVKFILQPFVENSISHGFRNILNGGLLSISVDWLGDYIRFIITDNGQGIPKDVLDSLNNKLTSYDEAEIDKSIIPEHLGIINVFLRLSLMYRDEFTMDIYSEKDKGTRISLIIPPTI